MAVITLHTARQVVPMIYAYTTPEIARHNGWTKIGYTEQSVDKRLKQQTHTADVLYHEEPPLKELGAYLNPPVGKSGVNHRLRKISEIAENMRV